MDPTTQRLMSGAAGASNVFELVSFTATSAQGRFASMSWGGSATMGSLGDPLLQNEVVTLSWNISNAAPNSISLAGTSGRPDTGSITVSGSAQVLTYTLSASDDEGVSYSSVITITWRPVCWGPPGALLGGRSVLCRWFPDDEGCDAPDYCWHP